MAADTNLIAAAFDTEGVPGGNGNAIALAMVAAIKGYRMMLIMPETMSVERRASMRAYGAEIILVTADEGMEGARDLAKQMETEGKGRVLDQFANPDNPLAHLRGTGPEIWRQTNGEVTHFVSSMDTTGTIMGCSAYFKQQNPAIQIVGLQPVEGSSIPGIRRWPEAYLPKIFDPNRVDQILEVSQAAAEETARELASKEGIFAGMSSGGAASAAIRLASGLEGGVVVSIVCDRGDRYLSSKLFT